MRVPLHHWKVLVTGAGGKTGSIVVRKLLERGKDAFLPVAMVRSKESEESLRTNLGALAEGLEVVMGDVTQPDSLKTAMQGVQAVIVVTSAMPQIDKLSLTGVILTKLFTFGMVSLKPSFWFDEGKTPQDVDFKGQVAQIDAAKAEGIKQIVLVSSMGGTKPDHFLNTNMDNIVLWKRRAEKHLLASGVPYTIVHPGGLLPHPPSNEPAPGGKRQLYVGVNDAMMDDERGINQVPREDVGEVCVNCLTEPAALGRSFDLGSGKEGEGVVYAGDLKGLLAALEGKSCSYDGPALPGEEEQAQQ